MSFYGAVGAIIENQDGEILMVQEGKDHIHEKWDFPGGGWEDGESIIECLEREVLEETGYRISPTGFVGVYKEKNQRDGTETIVFVFKAEIEKKESEGLHKSGEILDFKFFKPEEFKELDLRHPNRLEILRRYRNEELYPMDLLWNQLNLLE